MSLKLLFIAVTWIVVTVALVDMTYRLPDTKPRDAIRFWFVLIFLAYAVVSFWNFRAIYEERVARNAPMTHTFSANAIEDRVSGQVCVIDKDLLYFEDAPGLFFESKPGDQFTLDSFTSRAVPSPMAGKTINLSNNIRVTPNPGVTSRK